MSTTTITFLIETTITQETTQNPPPTTTTTVQPVTRTTPATEPTTRANSGAQSPIVSKPASSSSSATSSVLLATTGSVISATSGVSSARLIPSSSNATIGFTSSWTTSGSGITPTAMPSGTGSTTSPTGHMIPLATILGVIIGVVFMICVLLACILVRYWRRRRQRRNAQLDDEHVINPLPLLSTQSFRNHFYASKKKKNENGWSTTNLLDQSDTGVGGDMPTNQGISLTKAEEARQEQATPSYSGARTDVHQSGSTSRMDSDPSDNPPIYTP